MDDIKVVSMLPKLRKIFRSGELKFDQVLKKDSHGDEFIETNLKYDQIKITQRDYLCNFCSHHSMEEIINMSLMGAFEQILDRDENNV